MAAIEATTLGALLDQRAQEHGGRTALAFPDGRSSYAELADRTEFLARALLGLGVRPGDPVGLLLPNCVDAIAGLFAAAKIGAIPVPINGRFKAYELGQVVEHSGMRMLLTVAPEPGTPDFPALIREACAEAAALMHRVVLGPEREPGFLNAADVYEAAASVSAADVERRVLVTRVRDTAMVMYTSGTTASPKGAMISHEALTRFAAGATRERLDLTPDDRVWSPLPLFHIGGIAFAIASLYAGAAYHHVGHFRPDLALDQLERDRCTVALPGFETIWLPVLDQPDFADRDLSALRIVMAVGVPERLRDMASRVPQATQVSCFGMTEASSFLSLNRLDDTLDQRVLTGGHPLPGMECRVVDPVTGAALPPGTKGELLFRGSNCFDGYFRDPELTARAFDAEGWFHTGDVATMDADGRVTFVSRLKDMLKVGGENVSAAEVEGYLIGHPAVGLVQVVAAPDARYVEVPAAFVQLKPGHTATEQELIDFCVGRIAAFRVPRYVRFVEEWPMSGTKIKKYVLRELIRDELETNGITEAPKVRATATA